MSDLTTLQKYSFILEEFEKRADKTLHAYDEVLLEALQIKPKQIGRMLDELTSLYDAIVLVPKMRKKTYKLIKPIDIFIETFKNSNEVGWLFNMAHEGDPEIFKELEEFTKEHKNIYRFKNSPFEDVRSLESKEIFKRLKVAVEHREYRKIKFIFDENIYDNLKCLELLFMDNNWYIAFVDSESKLRFGRISFIQSVEYASNLGSFQPSSVEKQMKFLENIQNSMSLFGAEKKIATIKASPNIARYFDKDMKIFLSSQKFVKKQNDGGVIFTLEYTQALEILPFIQKWLPDLIILEPQELRDEMSKKLSQALQYYN